MKDQATTRKCDNCGQPVLGSDVTCWHCGVQLKLQEADLTFPSEETEDLDEEQEGISGAPFQILFYAVLTAVIALALLLVIRSLGKQPRLANSFNADGTPTMELFAPDGSFSIEVPSGLVWYFPEAKQGQGEETAQMVNDSQFAAALQPLYGLASDGRLLLLGQAETGILVVGRSAQLGQLTVEKVVGSLSSEPYPEGTVLATKKGNNSAGSKLAMITLEHEDPPKLCRQVFLPDSDGAYLAAICAGRDQFNEQSAVIDAILNSLIIR